MAALPRRSRRPVQATLIGLARLAPLSVVLASPVPSSQHTLLDDEEWALVVPFAPVRGKPLARSPALGTLHQRGHLVSSEAIASSTSGTSLARSCWRCGPSSCTTL